MRRTTVPMFGQRSNPSSREACIAYSDTVLRRVLDAMLSSVLLESLLSMSAYPRVLLPHKFL